MSLVYAFVTSLIDQHCCSLLVDLPLGVFARLDRVLRSAARLVGRISKFSSVSAYMHDALHWLPISRRIYCIATWFCITFLVMLHYTSVTSVTQCLMLQHIRWFVLLLGWVSASTDSLGHHTAPCFFGCGPIHLELPPLELRSLLVAQPSKFYNSLSLVEAGLGVLLSSFLMGRYTSSQNEWMNEIQRWVSIEKILIEYIKQLILIS